MDVTVTETTAYVLVAGNEAGETVTSQRTVRVVAGAQSTTADDCGESAPAEEADEGDADSAQRVSADPAPAGEGETLLEHRAVEETIYRMTRKVKPSLTETPLSPETRFEDFSISSLELAMITFEIEDHYNINISSENLDTFINVAQARDLVLRLLGLDGGRTVPA